jgi:sulfonate transport system substrate-binding protein
MSVLRLFFWFAALAVITPLVAETPPPVIRFGEVGGSNVNTVGGRPRGTGLVSLALELGFFEQEFGKNGPKIEQIFMAGTGPAQNEALAQGAIDFGRYGGIPNVIGLSSKIPAKIVLASHAVGSGNNYYIAVRNDAPFKTVADLKGKRITVQIGTNPYQSLIYLLEARGLSEKDVKIVNLQGSEALVAFKAGAVDAVFGGVNLLILRDKGELHILEDTKLNRRSQGSSGTLVADKFAAAYPETTHRVIKVLIRTAHWSSEETNREAFLKFISERSFAWSYIQHDYDGPLKDRQNVIIDDWAVEAFKDNVRFAVKHRLIRKPVSDEVIRSWFEPKYVEAALRDLGLTDYWPRESAATYLAGLPK